MEKRKLSVIPKEEATDEMIDIAKRLTGLSYIIRAKLLFKNKILLLTFHRIEDTANGKRKAEFRTFLSQDDYITQDSSVSNVKWLTSSFMMMNNISFYRGEWSNHKYKRFENVYVYSTKEKELISAFFKDYTSSNDEFIWDSIIRFQNSVLQKRLNARHKKETDAIDKVMNTVKPVPKDLIKWIKNEKLPKYLVYKVISKSKVECECTHCKFKMVVDKKSLNPKNNDTGICPHCGNKVIFKAKGRLACRTDYKNYVAYIDPMENGFIMRYFHIIRNLYCSELKVDDSIIEVCRDFYYLEDGKLKLDKSYEWTRYKNTDIRWCNDEGKVNCGYGFLYNKNLPEAWEHTPMKYSALEILAEETPIYLSRIVKRYADFPRLEWIIKMGLYNLAKQFINNGTIGYYGEPELTINKDGKTIYEILMLDKNNVKMLQEINGDKDMLILLQASQRKGFRFTIEQLKSYYSIYGNDIGLLNEVGRNVTLHKIMKYIDKESVKYPNSACSRYLADKPQNIEKNRRMAHDWLEYLGWCEILQYDLSNMFIYMPTNFLKVHDRTAKEYQAFKDKEKAEAKERYNNIIKQMKEDSTQIPVFNLHKDGLFIKLPDNSDEIKKEGEILHHCVGGYVDMVAKGETIILFIRKESNPDEPFYTMEWKGKVIQCRGSRNCDMTSEVRKFVSLFTAQMFKYEQSITEKAKVS